MHLFYVLILLEISVLPVFSISVNVKGKGGMKVDANNFRNIDESQDLKLRNFSKNIVSGGNNGFLDYVTHMKKRGSLAIKHIGSIITKELDVKRNLSNKIIAAANEFETTMDKYYTYVNEEERFVITEEFMLLNMLDTGCRNIYKMQWKLLRDALNMANSSKKFTLDGIKKISEDIYSRNMQIKKSEIAYLCARHVVCKPYPAFSDYLENFVLEAVRLPGDKPKELVIKLRDIIKKSNGFTIMCSEITNKRRVMREIEAICRNVTVREGLRLVKAVLNQRYKIIHSPNVNMRIGIQAARALLETVDLAFHYDTEQNIAIDYEATIKLIRAWAYEQKPLYETVLVHFIENIFKAVNLELNPMKVALIETIIRVSSERSKMHKDLFLDGFQGVRK